MTIKGASAVLPALLFCSCAWAFEPAERPLMPLRGAAPHAQRPLFEGDRSDESGAKSPGKAFLLSLAIPGMGEFYAGAKKRAVGFVAVEALTWISYARWRSRGGDLRTEFPSLCRPPLGRKQISGLGGPQSCTGLARARDARTALQGRRPRSGCVWKGSIPSSITR